MKKKSKDFMIYFDDNGVAKYYDDTYDITIHCESEEEQRATLERIRSKRWVPCSERLPENEDNVLCCTATKKGLRNVVIGYYILDKGCWACAMNSSNVIAWTPLPEPYKEEAEQIESSED